MRLLLVSLVAVALALPAVALAQGSSAAGVTAAAQSVKKKKARTVAKKKATKKKAVAAKAPKKKAPAKTQSSTQSSTSTAGEMELTGPLAALDTTSATVGSLTCTIPPGMTVTGVVVGDLVEIDCRLVAGVWTLTKLSVEDAGGGQGEVEVSGPIVALDATSVTVGATTCAIPAGVTLTGFQVGTNVELECDLIGGVLTLSKLKVEDDSADENGNDDSGPSAGDDDSDDDSGPSSESSGSGGSGGDDGDDD